MDLGIRWETLYYSAFFGSRMINFRRWRRFCRPRAPRPSAADLSSGTVDLVLKSGGRGIDAPAV